MKSFGEFLLRGRLHAGIVALLFALYPPIGWISLIIIAFVTLRKGTLEGFIVMCWGILPTIAWAIWGHPSVLLFNIVGGFVLIWVMAIILRHMNSWGSLLEILVLASVVIILLVHLVYPEIAVVWKKMILDFFHNQQQLLSQVETDKSSVDAIGKMITDWTQSGVLTILARMMTGGVFAYLLVINLINLALARYWQASIFNPGGLRKELISIRFGYVVGISLPICLLLMWLQLNFAWDVFAPIVLLFVCSGLSLVHNRAAMLPFSLLWLVIFYVLLVLLTPYSIIALLLLAFLDCFVNFRMRLRQTV